MTKDSKRKIVTAARRVFYERGYDETSFADVARVAGVPKGNFYYHFKSKTELLAAVLDARAEAVEEMLRSWSETHAGPKQRLERFVGMLTKDREDLARFGCPMGSLLTELGKGRRDERAKARGIFDLYLEWIAKQFAALGCSRKMARVLAQRLLARCQGAVLLAHAYEDPRLLGREISDVRRWIAEIADRTGAED